MKIVGVFANKTAAMEQREEILSEHDNCGHGDILVGGTWDDDIDIVVKKAAGVLSESTATSKSPHVVLWLPHHGKGRRKTWSKMRVLGVFATKKDADEHKRKVMQQHECCGHGDILVGGTWADEIDLIVKKCTKHRLLC